LSIQFYFQFNFYLYRSFRLILSHVALMFVLN